VSDVLPNQIAPKSRDSLVSIATPARRRRSSITAADHGADGALTFDRHAQNGNLKSGPTRVPAKDALSRVAVEGCRAATALFAAGFSAAGFSAAGFSAGVKAIATGGFTLCGSPTGGATSVASYGTTVNLISSAPLTGAGI
jgi:hypothetical protein